MAEALQKFKGVSVFEPLANATNAAKDCLINKVVKSSGSISGFFTIEIQQDRLIIVLGD